MGVVAKRYLSKTEVPRKRAEDAIGAAKLLRACGGCLGARRRRRAWKTAIIPEELSNER
jgi:hypothetical protein